MPSFWENLRGPGVGHTSGSDFDSMQGLDMATYVSYPVGNTTLPAVIVVQEAWGVTRHIQKVCDRLAKGGYVVVAPALFHRDAPNPQLSFDEKDVPLRNKYMGSMQDEEIINDINLTIKYLQQTYPRTRGQKIGIMGFCVGGRITYLAASSCPGLSAAVPYYPGRLFTPMGDGRPSPFELTSQINIPIMGNFGAKDANPSPDEVAKVEAELKKHGKTYDFKIYPDAGHGFNCDDRADYREGPANDAWARTLSWFNRHLGDA